MAGYLKVAIGRVGFRTRMRHRPTPRDTQTRTAALVLDEAFTIEVRDRLKDEAIAATRSGCSFGSKARRTFKMSSVDGSGGADL